MPQHKDKSPRNTAADKVKSATTDPGRASTAHMGSGHGWSHSDLARGYRRVGK